LSEDVRHVGERLDVVHERGVVVRRGGEQAQHERSGHAGQRQAALDDLLQSRLFPEEVQIRPENHVDADPAEAVGGSHLGKGVLDRRDLRGGDLLQDDVGVLRTHGVRGDRESLQHLIGVGAKEEPILERGGLPLCGVADREAGAGADRAHQAPLLAGRKARAAPAPQTAPGDLLDHRLRGCPQGDLEPAPPTPRLILG
jgi:hypothetical protein